MTYDTYIHYKWPSYSKIRPCTGIASSEGTFWRKLSFRSSLLRYCPSPNKKLFLEVLIATCCRGKIEILNKLTTCV